MPNTVENKEDLRSFKALVRSQAYQLEKLNEVNKKINNLEVELKGGSFKEKEKGF